MEEIRFLPVTTLDGFRAVEALAFPIWREHYTPLIGPAQVDFMLQKFQTAGAVESQVAQGALYFLLQTPGGNEFGFLSALPRPGELFLSKLYFLKSHRGRGYARQVLEFLRDLARQKGLSRITLTVHKQNPSVTAYRALGFEVLEPVLTDIGGGFVMDDYRMGMDLG